MATEFVCTIESSGGDYTTLTAWEAANQCDLTAATTKVFGHGGITGTIPDGSAVEGQDSGATGTATHVTATQILIHTITGVFQSGEQIYETQDTNYVVASDAGDSAIATAECHNDWPSGLSDKLFIVGWTTDATNYVRVHAPEAEAHDGTALSGGNYTGFAIKASTTGDTFGTNEAYTRAENLIVDSDNKSPSRCYGAGTGLSHNLRMIRCIGLNASAVGVATYQGQYFINCLIYDCGDEGFWFDGVPDAVYNCNAIDNTGYGFQAGGGKLKNCLAKGNTAGDFYLPGAGSNCASGDDTADDGGGSGHRINQTFTFVDEANDNFQLASNDAGAKGYGTDLSGDGVYPFDDDIARNTRTSPWDIGCWKAAVALARSFAAMIG